jgi:hypothetical protein
MRFINFGLEIQKYTSYGHLNPSIVKLETHSSENPIPSIININESNCIVWILAERVNEAIVQDTGAKEKRTESTVVNFRSI